ncbi:hypothetical protein shim_17600 [Shimia sp. SK013]|uniref:hypothetical protein n=1 Tax=Shimia sp. SK013 TaxID=1389006 RepID=UPI0006B66CB8|nr:hypothetical protein [Shimia sp. SK013]KPA21875.1 hypothetical protein shim_17600 [Shimia sp. SK013]
MHPYFMNFHVKGEVAGTLLLKSTKPKLLVDLSRQTAADAQAPGFRYPDRVCFTIRDDRLIQRFQREISVGDVIEAHGAFEQSGYLPHGNIHVDTTFEMRSFLQRAGKQPDLSYAGRVYHVASQTPTH